MSFFSETAKGSGWSGFIKQAINNVESHLDKVLDFPDEEASPQSKSPQARRIQGKASPIPRKVNDPLGASQGQTAIKGETSPPKPIPVPLKTAKKLNLKDEILQREESESKAKMVKERPEVKENGDVKSQSLNSEIVLENSKATDSINHLKAPSISRIRSEEIVSKSSSLTDENIKPEKSPKENMLPLSDNSKHRDVDYKAIAEQREQQLINAIQGTSALNETISQLQIDLQKSEDLRASEIAELKEKIQALERKETLNNNSAEALARLPVDQQKLLKTIEDFQKQVIEKDEQISGLMLEGEKLSKRELKISTILQKVRAKEAESDKALADCQKKLGQSAKEISELKTKLSTLTSNEKALNGSVRSLKQGVDQLTKEKERLEIQCKKLTESETLAKSSLGKVQAELKSLQKDFSKAQSNSMNSRLEKEIKEKQSLAGELIALRCQLDEIEAEANSTARALRQELTKTRDESSAREEELQKEITDLQIKMMSSGATGNSSANLGLESIIEAATRPLTARINSLQETISQTQKQLHAAEKTLKASKESYESLQESSTSIQNKLKSELKEKSESFENTNELNRHLQAQMKELQQKFESDGEAKNELLLQVEELHSNIQSLHINHAAELDQLRKLYEFNSSAQSCPTSPNLRPNLKQAGSSRLSAEMTGPSLSSRISLSVNSDQSGRTSPDTRGDTKISTTSQNSSLIDSTQLPLDSRVRILQVQLNSALEDKDHLSSDLVQVKLRLKSMEADLTRLEKLEAEYKDLVLKHDTALVLLGEKEEQVSELQADIQDMKEEYKSQISELFRRLEAK